MLDFNPLNDQLNFLNVIFIDALCGSTYCTISGETCVDGICKCGGNPTCSTNEQRGSYCDATNGVCKCAESVDLCATDETCENGECGMY